MLSFQARNKSDFKMPQNSLKAEDQKMHLALTWDNRIEIFSLISKNIVLSSYQRVQIMAKNARFQRMANLEDTLKNIQE